VSKHSQQRRRRRDHKLMKREISWHGYANKISRNSKHLRAQNCTLYHINAFPFHASGTTSWLGMLTCVLEFLTGK